MALLRDVFAFATKETASEVVIELDCIPQVTIVPQNNDLEEVLNT